MAPGDTVLVNLPDRRVREALAPALAAFTARHPGVRCQPGPARGPCDVTIRLEPPTDPARVAHRLGTLRARLYAAPDYLARHAPPGLPAELAAHDCIGVHAGQGGAPARWLLRSGPDRAVVMTRERYCVDAPGMALQLALLGAGIAPLCDDGAWREAGLVPVLPDWELEPVTLYALTGTRRLPARTRALIDCLAQALAA